MGVRSDAREGRPQPGCGPHGVRGSGGDGLDPEPHTVGDVSRRRTHGR